MYFSSESPYARNLWTVELSRDRTVQRSPVFDKVLMQSAENMSDLADNSVALTVTSPPYHVGKDYDGDASFAEYLALLERFFEKFTGCSNPAVGLL